MELSLDGSVVLVTGGVRGVGLGITRAFLSAGATVVTCARRPGSVPGAARFAPGRLLPIVPTGRIIARGNRASIGTTMRRLPFLRCATLRSSRASFSSSNARFRSDLLLSAKGTARALRCEHVSANFGTFRSAARFPQHPINSINFARLARVLYAIGVGQGPPRAPHRPSTLLLTRMFTETRRFCALPSGVVLSAKGSASAIPVGVSIR